MLLLPVYIDHLGASKTEIASVMVMASIGGLLFRPLVGWALDNVGRRPTLMVGTAILGLSMLALGFVSQIGPAIYAVRFFIGVGAGTLFTGYFAYVSDFIPAERRTEGLAIFGVSGLLPVAFNAFVHRLEIPNSDLNLLYPVLSIFVLISLPLLIPIPETATGGNKDRDQTGLRSALSTLLKPKLLPTWGATVAFSSLVAVFMTYATLTALNRGIAAPADLWIFYAGGAIGVRVLGSRLPDRIGPYNLLVPALASYASAYLVLAAATTSNEVCLAGLLAGLGHGYCFPVLTSQVITRMPDRLRGTGLATFTAIWELSSLGLTPIYGAVSDHFGSAVMFSLGSVVAIGACSLWVVAEHRLGNRFISAIGSQVD